MTFWQKVIKYLAIAFAIFLIVNIIGVILSIIGVIGGIAFFSNTITDVREEIIQDQPNYSESPQVITDNIQIENITKFEIDVKYSTLEIKNDDTFKVESNDKNVTCTQRGNELIIKETGNNWLNKKKVIQL